MPHLPRDDNYWKREDEEIIMNATIVILSIILGVVVVWLMNWGIK
jgi:hypothetical protein